MCVLYNNFGLALLLKKYMIFAFAYRVFAINSDETAYIYDVYNSLAAVYYVNLKWNNIRYRVFGYAAVGVRHTGISKCAR